MADKHINCNCPKCNTLAVFYLAENYLKSKDNPIKMPPIVYCENCGYSSNSYKKYLPFVEK